MTNLDKRVDSKNLMHRYKGNTADPKFDEFDNAIDVVNNIRNGKKELISVKKNQEKFKSLLSEIKKGSKKSKEQKNTVYNIEMFYNAINEAIKFYDDYSLIMSEAKTKAKNQTSGKGLKILTPKQSKCFKDYL